MGVTYEMQDSSLKAVLYYTNGVCVRLVFEVVEYRQFGVEGEHVAPVGYVGLRLTRRPVHVGMARSILQPGKKNKQR